MTKTNKYILLSLLLSVCILSSTSAQQYKKDNGGSDNDVKTGNTVSTMNEYLDILNGSTEGTLPDPAVKQVTRLQDLTTEELREMIDDEGSSVNKTILLQRLRELEANGENQNKVDP